MNKFQAEVYEAVKAIPSGATFASVFIYLYSKRSRWRAFFLSSSKVYMTLQWLLNQGYLTVTARPAPPGSPNRVKNSWLYQLTDKQS